jgi:hypothetical protein
MLKALPASAAIGSPNFRGLADFLHGRVVADCCRCRPAGCKPVHMAGREFFGKAARSCVVRL